MRLVGAALMCVGLVLLVGPWVTAGWPDGAYQWALMALTMVAAVMTLRLASLLMRDSL